MLEVIRPETPVTLAGGIVAGVLSVSIGPNHHVRYEVAYWSAGVRYVQWVEAVEVVSDDPGATLAVSLSDAKSREVAALRKRLEELTADAK
jgi:hypothetical protein